MSAPEWLAVYVERVYGGFSQFAGMLRWFFQTSWREEQSLLAP